MKTKPTSKSKKVNIPKGYKVKAEFTLHRIKYVIAYHKDKGIYSFAFAKGIKEPIGWAKL